MNFNNFYCIVSSKISICGTAFVNFIMVIIAGEGRCRRVQIYADVDLISCRAQPIDDGAVGGGTNKTHAPAPAFPDGRLSIRCAELSLSAAAPAATHMAVS